VGAHGRGTLRNSDNMRNEANIPLAWIIHENIHRIGLTADGGFAGFHFGRQNRLYGRFYRSTEVGVQTNAVNLVRPNCS